MLIPALLYDAIIAVALALGINPLAIAAVMAQESGCQIYPPDGDSGQSHGPMQLYRKGAGTGYTIQELRNPIRNIQLGATYLAKKIRTYDPDIRRAFTAYNWPVRAWQTDDPSDYGLSVYAIYRQLEAEGIQRDPPDAHEPTDLAVIDAIWGFLDDAAAGATEEDRNAARDAGRAHLLLLKERWAL